MALAPTYRRKLYERAQEQYGYVTTRDAEALKIPPVELRKIAQRGGLRRVARGVYRFDEIPTTAHDQLMEAVLVAGPGAHLTHDAVLDLHNLGLVNPRKIRVGTERRIRGRLPDFVELIHEPIRAADITVYEGIPSTTVERALIGCKDTVMRERLIEATKEAARRGLLRRAGRERVLEAIGEVA